MLVSVVAAVGVAHGLRVFVAGQRVMACEIRTEVLDFRNDPGAEIELLGVALDKLTALRLIEVGNEATPDGTGGVIRSRPAIARFALAEPTIREPGSLTGGKTGTNQARKAAADAASTIF